MLHALVAEIGAPFIPNFADASAGGAPNSLRPFLPELILIGTLVATLLTPFFARRSNIPCALVALAGLSLALLTTLFSPAANNTFFVGMLVSDQFSQLWKVLLLLFTIGVVIMWFATSASSMREGDGPEFFTLLVGAATGMCFMSSASNLLMIFLAAELTSLPSYVLAGFRKTHRVGSEASLKYVLFGAATSAMMAFGLSYLYGLYGTLNLAELAPHLSSSAGVPLVLGIAGLLIGIGFKISAVPFHFWCPDVFEGAGIDVSVFLSVASKGAGLTLLLRVLLTFANGLHFEPSAVLSGVSIAIGVMGAITATVGNTGAFVQNNIKRLLAYSSIGHAGYMLCALSLLMRAGASSGTTPGAHMLAHPAAQALLLYLAVYMFMNLGAFTVAGLVFKATGSESLPDYAGLGRRNPLLAMCMAAFMFSLVGLPPFAGFVAKLNLMFVLAHGWWWALVVVIGVNTILSLYYYARVIRVMYLNDSDKPAIAANPLGLAVSVVCALMLVLMLVAWNPLNTLTTNYGRLYVPAAASPAVPVASAEVEPGR